MDVVLEHTSMDRADDWPDDCYRKYDRIKVLGKGSFGLVWMSHRIKEPVDEFDDEYVAVKSIHIKDEKGSIYAEREISILQELRHPNVIRLIHAYPIYANKSRVVVMQLAQGPNLNQLVVKRGALGLPLARLVSRHLVAAVSYLHGRAVVHRDIKPSNCILALSNEQAAMYDYDWYMDNAIWSNNALGKDAVDSDKWKLMLADFGFARALETGEIDGQTKKMRNSIVFESTAVPPKKDSKQESASLGYVPRSMYGNGALPEAGDEEDSIAADLSVLESVVLKAADSLRDSAKATNTLEEEIFADEEKRPRDSGVSMVVPLTETKPEKPASKKNVAAARRKTVARQRVRSMSALGTKAFAAPEIRKQLRNKTEADFEKANAAMTECVADYGMIVDAYSVGWTLRVALTGVPPNFTISEYMNDREEVVLEDPTVEYDDEVQPESCCCFMTEYDPIVKIRDPSMLPAAVTLLITRLSERNPEDRMTVREAQNDPWIAGNADDTDPKYSLPQGDFPSCHGDPVVPLKCAAELSKLTVQYHMT